MDGRSLYSRMQMIQNARVSTLTLQERRPISHFILSIGWKSLPPTNRGDHEGGLSGAGE